MTKIEMDKEKLYKLYIIDNLTKAEISSQLGVSIKVVSRNLKEYNIKKSKDLFYKKIKQINMQKYGVENISQLNEVKEKKKEKSIKKFGVDNISKSEEVKLKKKQKSLEKYGTECVLQSEEIKRRIKQTTKEKYGVDNPMKCQSVKDKSKQTCFKKYGVEHPMKCQLVKEKLGNVFIQKYGTKNISSLPMIKEKIKKTNALKYGTNFPTSREEVKQKIIKTNLEKYGVPYSCMTSQCRNANFNCISKINQKFSYLLRQNDIPNNLEKNISNYSYDIEVKDTNIVIEINPTYTHNTTFGSEFRKHLKKSLEKDYHYNKTLVAKENGYRCIHIWDWDDKSKIINMLKPKDVIPARMCTIREVSIQDSALFLNENHLQGNCKGQEIILGLYYNDELVQLISFGKPRYNKKYEYELLRLCSSGEYAIIGGAEKLFKNFAKRYNPQSIISYCDNSKFNGDVYVKLGFELVDYGKPSKHWYNPKIKKHITDNLLRQRGYDQLFKTNYGKGTSNEKLMIENGFVEIYDSGQSTYKYIKN